MRITLNGDLGSGKSTVGRLLSDELHIPFISTGQIFREIGQISNMDALTTNLAAEDNSEIDFAVDQKIKEMDQSLPDFIIDSRLAWHFVRGATKVYLSVCPETAAQRVLSDRTRPTETYSNISIAMDGLRQRRDSENRRYRRLYGVDIDDMNNYDVVIITDDSDVTDIVRLIIDIANRNGRCKNWIPKSRLVPMISLGSAVGLSDAARSVAIDGFSLPLYVQNNFGFYFGSANALASAFSCSSSLVPFVFAKPTFPGQKDGDVAELAKRTMTVSDFSAWEDFGGVTLAFKRQIIPAYGS